MFGANLVIPAQIPADKVNLMDSQMDERTDTSDENTPSAWKAKGK